MLRPSIIILICALTRLSFSAPPQGSKSKMCANDLCTDLLFVSTVEKTQDYPDLLKLEVGQPIEILAIKFSDRVDMIEARVNGVTGRIYRSSIKLEDYVNFLKFSILGEKEYKSVAQETKPGISSVLGVVKSDLELVRDYNARATELSHMTGVEQDMMEIPQVPQKGHGHSHGGHGHSHSHGNDHGHSHEAGDGHGHSHDAPAETAKVEEVKVEAVTAAPTTEETKTEVPPTTVPPVEAQPATEEPKQLTEEEIEAEMQRLIEEDMKKLAEGNIKEPVDATAPVVAEEPVPAVTETPTPVVEEPVVVTTPPPVAVDLPTTTVAPPVEETPPPVTTTPTPVVVEEPVVVTTPPPTPTPIDELPPLHVTTTQAPPPAELPEERKPLVAEPTEYCYGKDECPPGSIPAPAGSLPPLDALPSSIPPSYESAHPADPSPPSTTIDPFADLPSLPNHSNFGRNTMDESTCNYKSSFLASTLRSGLPAVFGGMTDGSIGLWINVTLVMGALVIVMVSKMICEGGDGMEYDRSAAHNLATALKACQAQLAVKEAEAAAPRIDPAILQKAEMADHQAHQIRQLEVRLQHATEEVQRKTAEAEDASRKVESSREVIANAEMRASAAEADLRKKEEEVVELRGLIEKTHEKVESAKEEEKKERKARERMEEEVDRLKTRATELEEKAKESEKREKEALGENKKLESEVAQLAKLMEDMEKNVVEKSSEKSGETENGWDDDTWGKELEEKQTGEGSSANGSWSHGEEEESERNNLPARESASSSSGNIREMVKLRARTAQLESENETLRESTDREKSDRCRLEKERASLTVEIEKLKKELVEKEKEKKEATDRHSESHSSLISILKGVEARNDKLSEEVTRLQSEVKNIEEDKRSAVEKLREVESELKRLRNDYGHLETRHFNQTSANKKEIQTLKDQLAAAPLMSSRADLLNLSGTSSLDERGAMNAEAHSFWDEPSEAELHSVVQASTRRTPSSELLGSSHSRRSVRSRRSDPRFMPDSGSPLDSGSGGEQRLGMSMSREGREGPVRVDPMGVPPQRRMRSRSHGRTSAQRSNYHTQPPPMYMDYPQPMYGLDALARRHSRSGQQLYYSSGGSNGGRSPPPEMPLLPAMPPPGVRKPSSKRATGAPPPQ